MIQSDKHGVDMLHVISHIVDSNIMLVKSCVEDLGYTQTPSHVNHSIPLTTPMTTVPTFTSNIMATSTQNVIPTSVSHGGNTSSFIPLTMSIPLVTQSHSPPINVSQGGNSFNHNYFIPPMSLSCVTQPSPLPTYDSFPPPYS